MSHPAAPYVVGAAASVALFLTVLGLLAWQQRRNRSLLLVSLAFALFTTKSLVTLWDLLRPFLGHEVSELVSACFDLGILALLAAPLLHRRQA